MNIDSSQPKIPAISEIKYKKPIIFILVFALSCIVFIFREKVFEVFAYMEAMKISMPFTVALILICFKIVSAPLGFPGSPLTLLTGSLFGVWIGTLIAIIGNTIGALVAFLLARYVFRDYVQNKLLPKYSLLKKYSGRLESKPLATVVALRLIPLFPFNALNFLLGVTQIKVKDYFIGSLFGMIPGTFAYVYLGGSLRLLNPVSIGLAVLGLILLIYIGKYYEKRF